MRKKELKAKLVGERVMVLLCVDSLYIPPVNEYNKEKRKERVVISYPTLALYCWILALPSTKAPLYSGEHGVEDSPNNAEYST